MQKNIIIAGVGGQGILTIAAIIDLAAMNLGLQLKQAEVHGMSQRGGAVESHLRISTEPIWSDLIPLGKADLILSLEPMEALRHLPFLSPEGVIVSATEPQDDIAGYPPIEALQKAIAEATEHLLVEAKRLAVEAGNSKSFNLVMLGVASPLLGIEESVLERAITTYFAPKGENIVATNLKAFRLGADHNRLKTTTR